MLALVKTKTLLAVYICNVRHNAAEVIPCLRDNRHGDGLATFSASMACGVRLTKADPIGGLSASRTKLLLTDWTSIDVA